MEKGEAHPLQYSWVSLAAQLLKNPPAMQETPVQLPGRGDAMEKGEAHPLQYSWVSLAAQLLKNPPAMQETPVQLPGRGDAMEKGEAHPLQYSWVSLVAQLVKNPPAMREAWVGKNPWRRERLPSPVFWPGKDSLWGHKESDMTEQLSLFNRN
ncbi:unnamed protein product [Rangifer tarandus platyrhynchus]|uniref:Uncharacterized protein n=2 Tax=Rangifer tarandus platyrhynchus TaxID=3082113 RepID=A0AC60A531_RANTA|nr:unnamed protein product [Rangifer tarandus platyrhynchus]